MLYCPGKGQELLSALGVNLECHASSIFLVLKPQVGQVIKQVFASLPYIKGVTEPLTRVLKKHDITVVNKPLITLQQQLPAPKLRPLLESQTNVIYKIPCGDCSRCILVRLAGPSTQERKNTSEM